MLELVLFFVFGTIAVGAAINLLAQRHPINSALSLIVVMASLAALFLLMGAEFLAAIQVIVYAGAIMVLFVFVIMLLNAGEEERTPGSRVAMLLGFPAVVLLAGLVAWTLFARNPHPVPVDLAGRFLGSPAAIAQLLFRDFLLPFEITSILILIAIMGAVVLASPVGTTTGSGSPEQAPARREE
ncbi:MAG TPA: NADH-quinone oxidoreductase subunit J [Terriglobales bacterium]|jgi:NADH-quinone oxidoreductase subunit J|nr:NADH-quinone oxidoreductase subunit J [Terriglobales bacterium]